MSSLGWPAVCLFVCLFVCSFLGLVVGPSVTETKRKETKRKRSHNNNKPNQREKARWFSSFVFCCPASLCFFGVGLVGSLTLPLRLWFLSFSFPVAPLLLLLLPPLGPSAPLLAAAATNTCLVCRFAFCYVSSWKHKPLFALVYFYGPAEGQAPAARPHSHSLTHSLNHSP